MSCSRRQFLATSVPMASLGMYSSADAGAWVPALKRKAPLPACIIEWSSVPGSPPYFIGSAPLFHDHEDGLIEHFRVAPFVDLLILRDASTNKDVLRRALQAAVYRHVVVAAHFNWASAWELWNELEQHPVSFALERCGPLPFLAPPRRCGQIDPAGLRSLGFTRRSSSDQTARAIDTPMRSFAGPNQAQPTKLTIEFSDLSVPKITFFTHATRIT